MTEAKYVRRSLRALSGELAQLGHEVSVVLPFYRCLRENKALKPNESLEVLHECKWCRLRNAKTGCGLGFTEDN